MPSALEKLSESKGGHFWWLFDDNGNEMKEKESILRSQPAVNGFHAFEGRTEQNISAMRKIGDHFSGVFHT